LDKIIWEQVIELLEDPELIRQEIQRRLLEIQNSNPMKKRKEVLIKEITRQQKSIGRLLDAYQEGLLHLEELRRRLPDLRKRSESLQSELRSLEAATGDRQSLLRLADNLENFLERLRSTADTLDVLERQKILRLVVKEILIHKETIKIRHSIPITGTPAPSGVSRRKDIPSYLLRSGSHHPTLGSAALTPLAAGHQPDLALDRRIRPDKGMRIFNIRDLFGECLIEPGKHIIDIFRRLVQNLFHLSYLSLLLDFCYFLCLARVASSMGRPVV